MSERDAKVRLNLAAAGFLSMMKELEKESSKLAKELEGIGDEGEKSKRKLHPMLESAKKGLGAARSEASRLGGTLKSTLATAVTLGGALSVGKGIKDAISITDAYKNLAFAIRTGTGQAMQWEQVQQDVQNTANRWRRSNEEVAESYHSIFAATGDVAFAKKATDEISKIATATGTAAEPLRNLAAELQKKFGIGKDEIADTLAHMVQLGNQGDATLEELGTSMGLIGSSAKLMGLEGREGLEKVVGMLNVATRGGGNLQKSIVGVQKAMDRLSQLGDEKQFKEVEKKLGVNLTTDDGGIRPDAIEEIIKKTGGQREVLAKVFSGESLKFMTDFGATFNKAFDEAEGTFKERSEAASAAFEQAIKEETEQRLTAADVEEEAVKRREDVSRKMTDAMNRFTDSFAKPETIAAMEKLAQSLPKLADALGGVVEFVADHPLLAGAGFVGLKLGGAAAGSMGGDLLKGAGKGLGAKVAGEFTAAAATSSKWEAAGWTMSKIVGPAIAGLIAFEMGKILIDNRVDTKEKLQGDLVVGGVQARVASTSGDIDRMREAEANLKAKIAKMEEDQGGFGGAIDTLMGGLVTVMPKMLGGDPDFVAPEQQMLFEEKQELKRLQDAIAAETQSQTDAAQTQERAAGMNERAAQILERAARTFSQGGGGGSGGSGTNGLPPVPPTGKDWWG